MLSMRNARGRSYISGQGAPMKHFLPVMLDPQNPKDPPVLKQRTQ
jgi:hypothetical protein